VEKDPAWASTLTEPVEITGVCDMRESKITHLSSFLHFTGRDENGYCADFSDCRSLGVAEGTFAGMVEFSHSSIEAIGNLTVEKPGRDKIAALFLACKQLKIAKGTFPGFVGFGLSGIEEIGDLVITGTQGKKFGIECCGKLKSIPKSFKPSDIEWGDDEVEERDLAAYKNVQQLRKALNRSCIAKTLRQEGGLEL